MNREQMINHLTLLGWEPLHSMWWFGVSRADTGLVFYHFDPSGVSAKPGVHLAGSFDASSHLALARDWDRSETTDLAKIVDFITENNL